MYKKIIERLKYIDYRMYISYVLGNLKIILLNKNSDKTKFSIITAVYNSEDYLDDYFSSILENKYDLTLIEIIIVDDGSHDMSKQVIDKYIEKTKNKYPNLIKYIYQKNQGQAIARNNGIVYAKGDWITFIDSDDYISKRYFKEVDTVIKMYGTKQIVSTKWINYYEDENKFEDNHPLTYRFNGRIKYFKRDILKKESMFQMAMNSVFFPRSMIDLNILVKDIKPQFEDAVFVNEFLLKSNIYNITFVKTAKYYYRKRENKSSTLNKAMIDKRRYLDLLETGYIFVLEMYEKKLGYVPNFIQNMVVYDLSWNIKEFENNKIFLTEDERNKREIYLDEIFKYIDFNILQNNWKYLWKLYQIGINNRYYNNKENKKAGVYYYYTIDDAYIIQLISCQDKWKITIDQNEYNLTDLEYKVYAEKINDKFFINKYYVRIPKTNKDNLDIKYYYENQKINISNFKFRKKIVKTLKENSLCIFYDRENRADDNAEVLYEWFAKEHPEFNQMYFAINKECDDYNRLKEKGFKVIDYGTDAFEEMYKKADFIFSSALDKSMENYKGLRYQNTKAEAKFVFLQHGVITDDLSNWISGKRIDYIIVSTEFEYNNLKDKYSLFEDQIILSGLPRYDLLENNSKDKDKKQVLLQFTWRMEYQNYTSDQFGQTEYALRIKKIITDNKLLIKLKKSDYTLKVILHPEVNKHIKLFENHENDVVQIANIENLIFREEFINSSLMITDYSSVFTDFTYLKKPVIFYQWDEEEFYRKHLYSKEMDYKKDGVGSVFDKHEDIISEIIDNIDNKFIIQEKYKKRVDKFFKFYDSNNCQRIYEYIINDNLTITNKYNRINIKLSKKNINDEAIVGKVNLCIGDEVLYTITANSIKNLVEYNNIIIPDFYFENKSELRVKIENKTNARIEYKITNKNIHTLEQKQFNQKYDIKKIKEKYKNEEFELFISSRGNQKNPKKIIISFGSYAHFDAEVRKPISYLGTLNEYLDDTLFLAFQDDYFVDGTYFLLDDKGRELKNVLINYIKKTLDKYNLIGNDIIFFGASKGASVVIDIASEFDGGVSILNAPQINLEVFYKTRTHHYGLVYKYLKYYNKHNYDLEDKLYKLIENNEVYYAYGNNDHASNNNIIERLEHKNLKKHCYNLSHRKIAATAWNEEEKYIINKLKNTLEEEIKME